MKVIFDFESGEAFEIEIPDKIVAIRRVNTGKNITGYERVESNGDYYVISELCNIKGYFETCGMVDNEAYNAANYYSDKTVAENNARADKLHRQLRRFAVEHREKELDWNDEEQKKFVIVFVHYRMELFVATAFSQRAFGGIYFDSEETAKLAIDTFKDELMWYFTEYKDSL